MTVTSHLGRAKMFLIYDVTDGKPVLVEQRPNKHAARTGSCSNAPKKAKTPRDHADVLAAVSDCTMVVARGMGKTIAEDLAVHGIKPVLIDRDLRPFEAAACAATGQCLKTDGLCDCEGN
jgi:predicted Fe-Mo cluster-binding NifX family protein